MSFIDLFSSKVFNLPILGTIFSYFIQNTLVTVLIILLFGLVILHEPISHLFIKNDEDEYHTFERKHFWQTLILIPIVAVPFIWLMYRFGIFEIYLSAKNIWMMALQFIVMVVLHDAYFYWCHRLLHTKAFWNIHGVHHRATDPNILTSHIFHYIETFINYTFIVWFTLLAGLTVGGIFFLPAIIFTLFTITWNVYGHGKKNLLPDSITKSWLGRLIVWPSYHLEHHRKGTGNFEFFFTWWDKLCQTRVNDK